MPRGSKNVVYLMGRLGNKPEIRFTPTGQKVANVSLATNEGYRNSKTEEWIDKTEWHSLILWERNAEMAQEWDKGDMVDLQGKLTTKKWDDNNNITHYRTKITVLRVFEHIPARVLKEMCHTGEAPETTPEPPESFAETGSDDMPF